MKTLLLLPLLVSVCFAGVSREIAELEEEIDRRELLEEIDGLERELRRRKDAKELLTFNVGMLPAIPRFSERRQALPDVISNLDADFVCIQEAWFMQDVATILNVTSDNYPYSYSYRHSDLSTLDEAHMQRPPCHDSAKFNTAMACTMQKCIANNLSGFELMGCSAQYCGLLDMGQDCASCVTFSGGAMEGILGCATPAYSVDHLGLLVLSKEKPKSYSVQFYDPGPTQFLPRGYIQVEFSDLKTIICTHLTAEFEHYPEPLGYGSYLKQQESEIRKLVALAETKKELVLMGDLNTGPAVAEKNIQFEAANNYQIFKDNKFKSPYEEEVNECTWCASNSLITGNRSHEIDFILLHGNMRGSNAEAAKSWRETTLMTNRFQDRPDTSIYRSDDKREGHMQRVFDTNIGDLGCPLSDHYGVRMKVWRKELSWWQHFSRWACRWLPWCKKRSLENLDVDESADGVDKRSHLF